eukprot:CAMPEP_0179275612 /NCGR_PEP_ID=MMETSP0797-20121207/34153_1 /TAXON_ID=47934 /ORGANISM="Dinophysis acuminata, Strain DAEP01" /LENGTH=242 /DNA_ID=CAMNT_0020984145 /DNA_START=85 /DNA_END=813 /DNA_ORIENTATION=+
MIHATEAITGVCGLAYWWCVGTLPLPFFLPFLVALLVPIGKVCLRHPSLECVWQSIACLLSCALFVVTFPLFLLRLMFRYPTQAFHPLHAGLHVYVAVAAFTLCWCCESNVAVFVLWSVHSALLVFGLAEIALVRRLRWKPGPLWGFALQVVALTMYTANALCVFPKGVGAPHDTGLVVFLSSGLWVCLFCALSLATNWAGVVGRYRVWQNRNGDFSLQVPVAHGDEFPLAHDAAARVSNEV